MGVVVNVAAFHIIVVPLLLSSPVRKVRLMSVFKFLLWSLLIFSLRRQALASAVLDLYWAFACGDFSNVMFDALVFCETLKILSPQ